MPSLSFVSYAPINQPRLEQVADRFADRAVERVAENNVDSESSSSISATGGASQLGLNELSIRREHRAAPAVGSTPAEDVRVESRALPQTRSSPGSFENKKGMEFEKDRTQRWHSRYLIDEMLQRLGNDSSHDSLVNSLDCESVNWRASMRRLPLQAPALTVPLDMTGSGNRLNFAEMAMAIDASEESELVDISSKWASVAESEMPDDRFHSDELNLTFQRMPLPQLLFADGRNVASFAAEVNLSNIELEADEPTVLDVRPSMDTEGSTPIAPFPKFFSYLLAGLTWLTISYKPRAETLGSHRRQAVDSVKSSHKRG